MDGSVLEKKNRLNLLNLIGALTLSLLVKLFSRKSEPLIHSMKFFSPVVAFCLYKSKYDLAWDTIVMPGLVLATVT